MRAVILFETDDILDPEFAFEVAHVADLGTAEGVDRLVVVAHRKNDGAVFRARRAITPSQQFQPSVLQAIGILKFVDQDVTETLLVVAAQRFVALEQLVGAQQQFGEIGDALALTLRVVLGVELDAAAGEVVVSLGLRGANALFLVRVDEASEFARRKLLVVNVEVFQQALDCRQLVSRIEDLEHGWQPGVAVMCAQQAVAEAVKGADPHAARIDWQRRSQTRHHFLRRFVGEGDGENGLRPDLAGRNQPGDTCRQHAGFSAAGAGEDQGVLRRQSDGGKLRRIEISEQIGHGAGFREVSGDYNGPLINAGGAMACDKSQ